MATLGKPAINTPNALDLRALQTAISNTRQRIEALEAQLGITSSMAQTTSSTTTTNLNSILTQLSMLAARIAVLENATTTDVATFTAGESITIGQCVVPIGPNNVGVADPNDTTRMFGVVGVAISNAAAAGAAVQVQRRGVFAIPGATSFSAGHAVYVDTFGAITQTPDYDATAIPIGLAVSGSQIFIAPDWPALLQPTFSSGIEDSFEAYLPVTYRAMLNALSLEAQIAALPFNSGASADMQVPVVIGGVALRVSAGDIAALGGGGGGLTPIAAGDLLANLTAGSAIPIGHPLSDVLAALPAQSGAERVSQVPALFGGSALLFAAEDIAALSAPGSAGFLNYTTDGTLAGNSDALVPTEQAVKTYADTLFSSRTWKQEVRARTTGALPANTYNNGVGGVGATLTGNVNGALVAQDGVTPVTGDALLVMNEAAGANNGIYLVSQLGTAILPYILIRRTDADSGAELADAIVPVSEGTLYANKQFELTTPAPITVGTTVLVWSQIAASGVSLSAVNVFTKNQSSAPVALTDATTVALDASLSNVFSLLATSGVGATRKIGNATNATAGMVLLLWYTQSSGGSNALTWDTQYKQPGGGTIVSSSTNANTVDRYTLTRNPGSTFWAVELAKGIA